ncbi:hypothetical protein [Geodermatophilus ruber]|nr:hypothetical protein [Geodermatophilus ruber]
MSYTAYTRDGTYWTLRKQQEWHLVCRLHSGTGEVVERYGWYRRAGAAGTAVGALAYRAALTEARDSTRNDAVRGDLQRRLDEMRPDAVPEPDHPANDPPAEAHGDDPDQAE